MFGGWFGRLDSWRLGCCWLRTTTHTVHSCLAGCAPRGMPQGLSRQLLLSRGPWGSEEYFTRVFEFDSEFGYLRFRFVCRLHVCCRRLCRCAVPPCRAPRAAEPGTCACARYVGRGAALCAGARCHEMAKNADSSRKLSDTRSRKTYDCISRAQRKIFVKSVVAGYIAAYWRDVLNGLRRVSPVYVILRVRRTVYCVETQIVVYQQHT